MYPVDDASVLVALALIAGRPVSKSAGKIINQPPPATEFNTPLSEALKNRKQAWIKFIQN